MLKWLLRWLKPKTVNVYIPIFGDTMPYHQKWENEEYLKSVVSMGENRVWNAEIIEAISKVRNYADMSVTPDELKAYNQSIQVIKNLLLKPEHAKATIGMLDGGENSQLK